MVKIEFLEDENEKQQVVDLITQIATAGQHNHEYAELSALIAQVLDYLKETGVPRENDCIFVGKRLDQRPITISPVVKELTSHFPFLEARANWKGVGAFRAIFFFEVDSDGNQMIYFTKAVIKEITYSQEFEEAIRESELMRENFLYPN